MALFEAEFGDAGFVEIGKGFGDHPVVLFSFVAARAADLGRDCANSTPIPQLLESEVIDAWSKIVGGFIAAHSTPVALREGVLYVRVLQPALHYELEQISKPEILRNLKQRFSAKAIRDVRFRVG